MATLKIINIRGRDSGFSLLILFYISFVPALISSVHAVDKTLCSNSSYFVNEDNSFKNYLNTVVYSLLQDINQGFSSSSFGSSLTKVYGLLQCRGDTTDSQCYACGLEANTTIQQSCGPVIGGRIWLDFCFLRYENYDFHRHLDTNGSYIYNLTSVPSPGFLNSSLENLLYNLSVEAVSVSSLYASGTTTDSLSRVIYGLVQCTFDMSNDNCTACLSKTVDSILADYPVKAGVRGLMGSCIVCYEMYKFFNLTNLPPPPAEAPVPDTRRSRPAAEAPANAPMVTQSSNSTHSNKNTKILGGVAGGLLLAVLLCLFATTRRRLKSATIFRRGYEVHEQVEEGTLVTEDRQIVTFKMETLVTATENFRDDNKLGEGGFGPVYKGTTKDGQEIAVKKLSLNSMQGNKEFMNEVNLVAKIQHRNLVKLLGCCAEGSQKLLVYEYLPHGSLDQILFDPVKRKQFDWHNRYNVILGVARGLLYLHEDSQPRIIHRDIKASNILLDEKLNAKIADFGLAKLFHEGETHVSTRVAGTYGYMAPEYAMQGQLTAKADVYSFGVLLLELITGRKNTDYRLSSEMQILLGWAWRSYERGNSAEIIDRAITETCNQQQALRCIHVGLLCTQADSSLRPPMSTINLMLSSHSMTLPDPTKPVFANSVTRIPTRSTSSGSGLSLHTSATTSSASSRWAPALPSNPAASITELVPR